MYRVAGSRRWNLGCKNNWAYVWQRGRFEGDVGFWSERLDEPGSINPVKQGRSLSFKIYGRDALEAFRRAVTGELQTVSWLGAREIEQDDEEGDNDDA